MVTLQRFEIEDLIQQVENTLIHVNVYSDEHTSISQDLLICKLEHLRYTLMRILQDDTG